VNNSFKLIFLFFIVLSFSCNSSKKLADEFVSLNKLPDILFISNPNVLIEFFPISDSSSNINEKLSHILDENSTKVIKEIYDSSFYKSLSHLGFDVYTNNDIAEFFANEDLSWQVSISQISIEEHQILYVDEVIVSDNILSFDTIISEYQFNVWFEVTPVNFDSEMPTHVLFSSINIRDFVDGNFYNNWATGQNDYKYNYQQIKQDDIFNLIINASEKHSNYLFDYFMNRYVFFYSEKSSNKKIFYTYNKDKGKVQQAYNDRFIFL